MAPTLPSVPPKSIAQPRVSPLRGLDSGTGRSSHSNPTQPQDASNKSLREHAPLFDSDTMSTTSSHIHHLSPMSNATTLAPSLSSYNPTDGVFCPSSNPQMMHMEGSQSSLPPLRGPHSVVSGTMSPSTTDAIGMHPSHDSRLHAGISMNAQGYAVAPQANSKYNDMIIESQDIDTSSLGMDPLLWLDFVPQNVLDHFDSQNEPGTEASNLTHPASRS